MARNTNFKTRLAAFYILVVELYYSIEENAFSWLRTAKNGK